jgi:hypothetical protein
MNREGLVRQMHREQHRMNLIRRQADIHRQNTIQEQNNTLKLFSIPNSSVINQLNKVNSPLNSQEFTNVSVQINQFFNATYKQKDGILQCSFYSDKRSEEFKQMQQESKSSNQ